MTVNELLDHSDLRPSYHNEQRELEKCQFNQRRIPYEPSHAIITEDGFPLAVQLFPEDRNALKGAGYTISTTGEFSPCTPLVLLEYINDDLRIRQIKNADGLTWQPEIRRRGEPRAEVVNVNTATAEAPEHEGKVISSPFPSREVPQRTSEDEPPVNGKASLYKKMAAVMGELSTITRSGKDDRGGFRYLTSTDIYDATRQAMAKHNLAIFVSVERVQADVKPVTVDVMFTLCCGDTGATKTASWIGKSYNAPDKAVSSAVTNAEKYFLQSVFVISSDDPTDDPDNNKARPEAPENRRGPQQPAKPKAQNKPKRNDNSDNGEAAEIAPGDLILAVKQDSGVKAVVKERNVHDYRIVHTVNKMWNEHNLSEDETGVKGKLIQLVIDHLKKADQPESEAK